MAIEDDILDMEEPEAFSIGDEEAEEPLFEEATDEPLIEEVALIPDEEAANLVPALIVSDEGKKELKRIADFVYTEFTTAWDGQEGYRQRIANDHRLFTGDLPDKEFPFDKMANPHVPLMFENITRIQMRIESEVFGDWSNVMGVLPVGPDDKDTADLLTRHGNWQLSEQLTDFKRQMKRGLLRYIKDGDVVCHSYYDAARRKNCHDVLTSDEFVVPHVHRTVEPDFSDCPWVAKVLYRYRHDLQKMRDEWYDVDAVIEKVTPSWDDEPDAPLREEVNSENEIDSDDQRAPYKLIHWEGWLELPDQVDDRYCKVILDYATKAVLQLQILEEEDWQDRHRYEKQVADLEAYRVQRGAVEAATQALTVQNELAAQGMMDPAMIPPMPMAPVKPDWVESEEELADDAFMPAPIRKVPIHMFSHGVCIEPMAGALGMGYGKTQADHNRAVNVLLAQTVDAATLGNSKTFITAGGVSFDKPFQMAPGRVNVAKGTTPRDLKDTFIELNPGPANPQLIELVKEIQGWAQSSMQAPNVLSGESGKSGETYRGISTRVEQATKQLSVVANSFAQFLAQILRNNAKLNAKFLPEEEVVFVNNHKLGTTDELKVGRALYERDYRVVIKSDLRFASQQQRISEADQTLQMITSLPPLQPNLPLLYQALRETLIARSQDSLVPYLGPPLPPGPGPLGMPPPPPMPPPGMAPPEGPPPPAAPPPPGPPQQ